MDALTAPETRTTGTPTTRASTTSTRSRPRRWPSNVDTTARRRSLGHDDLRTPAAAPAAPAPVTPPVATEVEAPAVRRRSRFLHRQHVTALDRARLALVAALFAAATAAAALPGHDGATSATTARPAIPAVAPTATTAPCSPVAVNCCPGATTSHVDIVRDLRPVCP